jgi:hypothetical protein
LFEFGAQMQRQPGAAAFFAAEIFGRREPSRPSAVEILGFSGSLTTAARSFAADSLQMQQSGIGGLNRQLSTAKMLPAGSRRNACGERLVVTTRTRSNPGSEWTRHAAL